LLVPESAKALALSIVYRAYIPNPHHTKEGLDSFSSF